jgi:hypothetical protein
MRSKISTIKLDEQFAPGSLLRIGFAVGVSVQREQPLVKRAVE